MSEPDAIIKSLYHHHLVLPPRQPGREDHQKFQPHLVKELLQLFKYAALELRNHATDQGAAIYDAVLASLSTSEAVNVTHATQQQHLETAFKSLEPSRPLIIHIVQQNAGFLVWRYRRSGKALPDLSRTATAEPAADNETDVVVFEAFESSPCSEAVFSTDGALRVVFPGSACAVRASEFEDFSFQSNLARILCLACSERLPRFSARAQKASTSVIEPRDTTNPELITTWLVTILEANGSAITVPPIAKRVKDEVCWSEGAKAPWRRMPFYLVLRVGLRRSFQLQLGEGEGRLHYKLLITEVLAALLKHLQGKASWDMLGFVRAKVCRRMAKLEEECSSRLMSPLFQAVFKGSSRAIWKQVSALSKNLDTAWNAFKQRSRRSIQPMAFRFAPSRSLFQDMPSSRDKLINLVHLFKQDAITPAPQSLTLNDEQSMTTKYDSYARVFHNLVEEEKILKGLAETQIAQLKPPSQSQCCELSTAITGYVVQIRKHYVGFTGPLSDALLTLMDLWTTLDQCALVNFPLLQEFKPVFPIDILNVLQVGSWEDMRRLQRIQLHLNSRHASTTSNFTIFQDPVKNCFAEKFFDSSSEMQAKFQEIVIEADANRAAKAEELMKLMKKRQEIEVEISMKSCLFTTTDDFPPRQVHNQHTCAKCKLKAELRRQKILIHEYPLPQDVSQAKATVFEL